jgi:hypothetical protein
MGKIINNLIDIMEMGSSMLWSDLKRLMIKIIKVLRVEENDKSSNGISEEEEAYARQMIKLKMMIREEEFQDFNSMDESVFQDPMGLSKLTTSVKRDENGFPIDLKSKLRNDKND